MSIIYEVDIIYDKAYTVRLVDWFYIRFIYDAQHINT